MTVVWFVKIRAKEGLEEPVREGLAALVEPTRAQDGCLAFDVHRDAADPRAFSLYEEWSDHAAHDAHTRTDHFRDFAQEMVIDNAEPMDVLELARL